MKDLITELLTNEKEGNEKACVEVIDNDSNENIDTIINKYSSQGYEIKQIIPNYSPSLQGEGNFTFYEAGITLRNDL